MLLRNAYPSWLLDRIIKQSVSYFVQPRRKFGPNKERIYVGLPFLGKTTDHLRRSFLEIAKKYLPNKDVIIYFKPGLRISNFFRLKDRTPFDLQSNVVYKYTCAACNGCYIGKTSRHLRHRVAEHKGVSHLTGNTMKTQVHSNIRDHSLHCPNSTCNIQNFKILARGTSDLELLIKERLSIDRVKPALNGNSGALELVLF